MVGFIVIVGVNVTMGDADTVGDAVAVTVCVSVAVGVQVDVAVGVGDEVGVGVAGSAAGVPSAARATWTKPARLGNTIASTMIACSNLIPTVRTELSAL
jgi:hypothetical protein